MFKFKKLLLLIFLFVFKITYAQLSFTESSGSLGVIANYGASEYGGGVSFVDFDGDGWDDLSFASEENQQIHFFKNNSGSFSLVTLNGISNLQKTKQLNWVDYDNDGDKDLFVAGFIGSNKVYNNDGNMNFTEVSASIGLFQDDLYTNSISFGDIDNDGDLDVFYTHRDGPNENQRNYLYTNNNGFFTEITEDAGIVMTSELSLTATFFDYNNDGLQDIYVSNDKPTYKNRLYKNNGDLTFEDVSDSSGAGISINAMTTTIGDYNNDGWFDIYVTNTPQGNSLLKNNGDGTFTDVASSSNTSFDSMGWGAVFFDADIDGYEDLLVSGSFDGSVSIFISMAFYHNQQDGSFSLANNSGFQNDSEISFSNAIGDIDNDGKPEVAVSNNTTNHSLWKNETDTINKWLKVKLEGVASNKDGVGNKVEIFANGSSQYRFTSSGEGYLGQNSNYEFFGLGTATIVDYIKITWNKTGIVETITDVQPNQAITIQEGNGVLSVKEETNLEISIYPNPSNSGLFTIKNLKNTTSKVFVFDISGREILNSEILNTQTNLDLTKHASGIYFVKLISNGNQKVIKTVKN
jgi:hypothetical protein